jgi:hypothetical protein
LFVKTIFLVDPVSTKDEAKKFLAHSVQILRKQQFVELPEAQATLREYKGAASYIPGGLQLSSC